MNTLLCNNIFHNATQPYGGRMNNNNLPPNTLNLLEHHRRLSERWIRDVNKTHLPNMPYVHFDYVANFQLNAIAFEQNGCGFIGVYNGAISIIYYVFQRMMADRQILPEIGEIQNELEELPLMPSVLNNAVNISRSGSVNGPLDPIRMSYSSLLAEFAIDFLLYHEYTHLSNGHLGLLYHTNGAIDLAEIYASGSEITTDIEYLLFLERAFTKPLTLIGIL